MIGRCCANGACGRCIFFFADDGFCYVSLLLVTVFALSLGVGAVVVLTFGVVLPTVPTVCRLLIHVDSGLLTSRSFLVLVQCFVLSFVLSLFLSFCFDCLFIITMHIYIYIYCKTADS